MNAHQIRPSSPPPPPPASGATQYYVFSADNNHAGPVTADLIGRGVVAGKVPNDAFVAPLGSTNWVPLASIPELNLAVSAARVQHHSSIRPVPMSDATPGLVLTSPPPPPQDLANFLVPPPAAAAAAAVEPAASVAPAAPPAKAEEKKEEKKPALDPRFKLLPLAIFGAFAFLGVIETVIAAFVVK